MIRVMPQVWRCRAARGRSPKTPFTPIAVMQTLEVSLTPRGSPRRSVSWKLETPLLIGVVLPALCPPLAERVVRCQQSPRCAFADESRCSMKREERPFMLARRCSRRRWLSCSSSSPDVQTVVGHGCAAVKEVLRGRDAREEEGLRIPEATLCQLEAPAHTASPRPCAALGLCSTGLVRAPFNISAVAVAVLVAASMPRRQWWRGDFLRARRAG